MNLQAIKVKYVQCWKGGLHEGELLNTVCLNPQCKTDALCCCVCIDESHNGHKTTTLKKLLLDAKQTAKDFQLENKQPVKPQLELNNDILINLIDSAKKQTFQRFKETSLSIEQSLSKIEKSLVIYYNTLEQTIQQKGHQNNAAKIYESVESIQGASNPAAIIKSLQKLLSSLEEVNKVSSNKSQGKLLSQDSIINLIEQSNQQVIKTAINGLQQAQKLLKQNYEFVTKSASTVTNIFSKDVFRFSSELKNPDVWVTDSYKVVSKKMGQYQTVLMQPGISLNSQITVFRFKINKSSSNWIAVGMCHKNIVKKNNFLFHYGKIGHGCYLISSNSGSWSSISQQLNNKVKAFNFIEGDIITCVVNRTVREIIFVKDVPPGLFNVPISQRDIYSLSYLQDQQDQLHPCVVFYYENDQVQYVPAVNLSQIPKYEYLFSNVEKHSKIKVTNGKFIKAIEGPSQYRAALLSKSLQDNFQKSIKFSFKIIKSSSNWVAVGMCHNKLAASSNYGFNYQSINHGYYMISSNGGSWSSIDSSKNNVVRAFKFGQGDVVECEVFFGQGPNDKQNKIIFKKGSQSYQLNFIGVQGDKLYPCAMLHYSNDQICILPKF